MIVSNLSEMENVIIELFGILTFNHLFGKIYRLNIQGTIATCLPSLEQGKTDNFQRIPGLFVTAQVGMLTKR